MAGISAASCIILIIVGILIVVSPLCIWNRLIEIHRSMKRISDAQDKKMDELIKAINTLARYLAATNR